MYDVSSYNDIISRIKKIYYDCSVEERSVLRRILQEFSYLGYSPTYDNVWLADYKEIPVDKYTFLTDSRYLGASNNNGKSIYPAWMEVMKELERSGNQYYEIVFTGATRTGKTSTAVSDACYQLYKLMCLRDPQEYFSLKAVTRISFFFFNLNATLAKGVAFKEFNSTLHSSPWFMEHGCMNKSEATPTYIPEGGLIEIVAGSDSSHALGKATYCVIFDEVNFSQAGIKDTNKSKKRMKEKYDTLVARVTGTFVKHGEVFGKIYVISSKNSDSDFMEEYIAQQRDAGNEHMYIFDKPQWEVWPKSKYSSDETFYIAVGGKADKGFIVQDDYTEESLSELESQGYRLIKVPVDNKTRFLADFDIALRDIAGISVPGSLSFITKDVIIECIGDRKNPFFNDIVTIGTKDSNTLEEFFHLDVIDDRLKSMPMFIHLDLSLNTDMTGISGICISGRKDIAEFDGKVISQPYFSHLFSVSLKAPRGDKIPYAKITSFICWLRKSGFNICGISRDQFQSEYMGQLLEAQGFNVSKLSLDRTPDGYTALKSILLERRIDMLNCNLLQDELIHLQRDSLSGKIDHLVGGCFTGDTLVYAVINHDFQKIRIDEICKLEDFGSVISVNEDTQYDELKRIVNAFETKEVDLIVKVELSNGECVKCTPEHLFMLSDGSYVEARNLKSHHSLRTIFCELIRPVNITYLNEHHKVYDLTIEDNPNFSLGCGIFVHNSKDVADSFAGSIWNAVLTNPGVPIQTKSISSVIAGVNGTRSSYIDPLKRFNNYKLI